MEGVDSSPKTEPIRCWFVASMALFACPTVGADVITTYRREHPSRLWQGVAVQHFVVPYRCVGRTFEFFCNVKLPPSRFAEHLVHVQVYRFPQEHVATGSLRRAGLPARGGWVAVKGLKLEPGLYYAQLFTNTRDLSPHLRARLFSGDGYRAGHAARGWKGGVPLGADEDFQTRLTVAREPRQAIDLGGDSGFLVKDGKANTRIVLSRDSIPAEWTAAEELRDHLERMSGVRLPIVLDDEYESGPMVAVGFNGKLPAALQAERFGPLGQDELIIRPEGSALLLAGGRPRGTLYAVYEYLHRIGVRWYTPRHTKIPKLSTIPLPKTTYRYEPPIMGRTMNVGNKATLAWLARNRLVAKALWTPLGMKYGAPYAQGPDMHTFYRLVNKSVLEAHPDWCVEVDGKRAPPVGHTWGMCLSNVEARKYIINRTLDYARKHPTVGTVWVGQNDGSKYCTCKKCQAFYDAHGGQPSSMIVQLLNELSNALAGEMPDRKVKTLAYSWSLTPPTGMELRENAIVMFCPAGNYFNPIATDPKRESLRAAMAKWRKIAGHMDAYLYFPHESYWFPAPCTYAGAENIKWCSRNGADHVYAAVSGWMNWYGSESMNLRGWVYARLMWDPTLDTQALIDEFVGDYYGPASDAVASAIRWTHQDVLDEHGDVRKYSKSPVAPEYLNPPTIRKINELFESTHASLKDDVYKKRLRFAWIPYLWGDFWLGYTQTGGYDAATGTWSVPMEDGELRNRYGKYVKRFMAEHGVEALKELRRIDPKALGLDKMGVPWRACLLKSGDVEAVIVPGVGGEILDFRDKRLGFEPLNPCWGGLMVEYPLFGSTEDSVDGRQVTEYDVSESAANRVVLKSERRECAIEKSVSMTGGVLATDFRVRARKEATLKFHNCVMFNLDKDVFDIHPSVYVEKTDGTWTQRVMGSETGFWWVEGNLDVKDATGRIVIERQGKPEGVLMTFDPAQLETLYFWYDNNHRYPKGQCGMLRFFLHAKPRQARADDTSRLTWSLKILPTASAVVRGQ